MREDRVGTKCVVSDGDVQNLGTCRRSGERQRRNLVRVSKSGAFERLSFDVPKSSPRPGFSYADMERRAPDFASRPS